MKVTNCLYCGDKRLSYLTHRSDDNGIMLCAKCGIMMVENINDDTELLYTADYFEKSEGTKNGYTDYLSSPVANLIGKYGFARLFAKKVGVHLDLGCADGSLVEIFASEGFDSRGLEISKDAVKIAQDKGLQVSFSRLDTFPKALPNANIITAFDLLEHADKPRVVLTETYKNLAADGYFVFSTLSVKKNDPSDYWFNNSLEHYIYYNQENLTYALTEVFGEGNFSFVEIEINGVAEFWGFAKKGKATWEHGIIENINKGEFDKKDSEAGYLVSLFYNQLSKFSVSEKIIEYFESSWTQPRTIQGKFYNFYFQGKFEKAVNVSASKKYLIPIKNSVFWQALNYAETELEILKKADSIKEYNEDILELRSQVFTLKDELHTLLNSKVVGKAILAREYIGKGRHIIIRAKEVPKRAVHKVRVVTAPLFPAPARKYIKRNYKSTRAKLSSSNRPRRPIETKVVPNKSWAKGAPLVSVVIPYYNRADTIDDTISSLKSQTFINFEILLVDDGSSDQKSIDKLVEIGKANPEISVIHQSNEGVASARNKGISLAKGKYIICLDSDDMLYPTYIEKCSLVLETNPEVAIVTTHRDDFGVIEQPSIYRKYDALVLYDDNMVITAAAFRKEAWEKAGGYKSGIGYEDWELWLRFSEHGFWGKLVSEQLFRYRTSMQSRYIQDKDLHWNNMSLIRKLHPDYKAKVKKILSQSQHVKIIVDPVSSFINLKSPENYKAINNVKANVLITMPWMTFGGAETLIFNFCNELKKDFNISFITGLESNHEWEYKFKDISPRIYHLPNLFDDKELYIEFISTYIQSRSIDILHIIHTGFMFEMLEEIKKRHPKLKIIFTIFNDRVEYFEQSIGVQQYIDVFSTDNNAVAKSYTSKLPAEKSVQRIPNGIDCYSRYNPTLFNRAEERASLFIEEKELAVFFIGRLSEEKNPDVYLGAANTIISKNLNPKLKFFMIGDGGMRPEVETAVKAIGSEQVQYLGYQAEVARFLSAADIFVLPSSIEGFPLSILEAMAMKVAVVASDVGAVSDVLDHPNTGLVVSPGSEQEIVDAIVSLSSHPKKLQSVKESARKSVEEGYSNIALGKNYKKLYLGILK